VNDAVGMRNSFLSDSSRWELTNTTLIANEECTEAEIKAKLTYFAEVSQSGDLFVYFHSGHGGPGPGTDTFLYCYDDVAF